MRVAVDINHPGHVHFFKHFIWEMKKRGHKIFISATDKDVSYELLDHYGFEYYRMGSHHSHLIKKMAYMPFNDFKLFLQAREFKPDVLMAIAAIRASHASYFLKRPCFSFTDTEHASMQIALYRPLSTAILTPNCFTKRLGLKHRGYKGYHELAYLHPNRFKPDPSVLDDIGVSKDEKFALVRFVSGGASHDIIHSPMSGENKVKIVKEIEKFATPIITNEGGSHPGLDKYKRHVPCHKMHDALAYASIYVGDGGTMASEAVVLGTPSVYTNFLSMGYIAEEAKYGILTHTGPDVEEAMSATRKYLEMPTADLDKMRSILMRGKIDVTAMMVWFVENYPESMNIMEEDKHFDRRFK